LPIREGRTKGTRQCDQGANSSLTTDIRILYKQRDALVQETRFILRSTLGAEAMELLHTIVQHEKTKMTVAVE